MTDDGLFFESLMVAMDTTDEQWRGEAWKAGVISGHQHHCRIAHAVLTALATHLSRGRLVGRTDLLAMAEVILEHQHDTIDTFRARMAARRDRRPPSTQDTS